MAGPDHELRRGPGFDLLARWLFSLLSFLLILHKIRGGGGGGGAQPPFPRSATVTYNKKLFQTFFPYFLFSIFLNKSHT